MCVGVTDELENTLNTCQDVDNELTSTQTDQVYVLNLKEYDRLETCLKLPKNHHFKTTLKTF